MEMLRVRKLADRSGDRVDRYHPLTGQKVLLDPGSDAYREVEEAVAALGLVLEEQHEPWPFAGLAFEGDAPAQTAANTTFVDRGVFEGWITREGERVVHRPGGPAEKPYAVTHTFVHADALVFHMVDGDVRYRVVEQPDKYHSGPEGTDAPGDPTAEVRHFYTLEREG